LNLYLIYDFYFSVEFNKFEFYFFTLIDTGVASIFIAFYFFYLISFYRYFFTS